MTQNQVIQASLFDYAGLDAETRIVVQQRTEELKTMFRRTAEDIVEVGRKLDDVRDRLRDGQFDGWLRAEFNMSRRTAYNFMNVFERFGNANFAQLDIAASALYVLSAPSTSDEARQEALQLAKAGEPVTHSMARQIVDEHKLPRYCPVCGEQIADDVPGKYCAGGRCKYQATLIEPEEPRARVVTVPSARPPAPPPPPAPRVRPKPRPAEAKVVSTGKPTPSPLPPKPAPVMRPIQVGPKAVVLSVRILPGDGPLNTRQIMASIADEGDFPRTMEGGIFANLHSIIKSICIAFFPDELTGQVAEGQVLASEPISQIEHDPIRADFSKEVSSG